MSIDFSARPQLSDGLGAPRLGTFKYYGQPGTGDAENNPKVPFVDKDFVTSAPATQVLDEFGETSVQLFLNGLYSIAWFTGDATLQTSVLIGRADFVGIDAAGGGGSDRVIDNVDDTRVQDEAGSLGAVFSATTDSSLQYINSLAFVWNATTRDLYRPNGVDKVIAISATDVNMIHVGGAVSAFRATNTSTLIKNALNRTVFSTIDATGITFVDSLTSTNIFSDGNVSLLAGAITTLQGGTGVNIAASAGDIALTANAGDIVLANNAALGGISLTSGTSGDISLTGGTSVDLSVGSAGDINLNAGTFSGTLSLTSGTTGNISIVTGSSGLLSISGGVSASLSATGVLTLTSDLADVNISTGTAGVIDLTSGTTGNIAMSSGSGADFTMTSGDSRNISLTSALGVNITATAGAVNLTATAGAVSIKSGGTNDVTYDTSSTSGDHIFKINGVNRLVIDDAAPFFNYTSNMLLNSSTTAAGTSPLQINKETSNLANDNFIACIRNTHTANIRMDAAGGLEFSPAASDIRLKSEYTELTNTLDKIAKVPVYNGKMRMPNDPSTKIQKTYFIADELKEQFPELVDNEGVDGIDDDGTKTTFLAVKRDMNEILWAAARDAKIQIDQLRSELETLKNA